MREPSVSTPATCSGGSAPGRILVVDDVSYFRLITRKYLESAGHQVLEAGSAFEALEILAKTPIDLVVLDYQLPDIDGLSFFQKIQEEVESTSLCSSKVPPFILCTASLDDKATRRAAEMGFCDIFAKPVDATRLLASIDKALGSQSGKQ